jgi:hypothetical protein
MRIALVGLVTTGTWHWMGLHTHTSLGDKKRPSAMRKSKNGNAQHPAA